MVFTRICGWFIRKFKSRPLKKITSNIDHLFVHIEEQPTPELLIRWRDVVQAKTVVCIFPAEYQTQMERLCYEIGANVKESARLDFYYTDTLHFRRYMKIRLRAALKAADFGFLSTMSYIFFELQGDSVKVNPLLSNLSPTNVTSE